MLITQQQNATSITGNVWEGGLSRNRSEVGIKD